MTKGTKGVDFLVIPCEVADKNKPSIRPRPTGPVKAEYGFTYYECPMCDQRYYTYHACAKHMGLVSNIMGNCTGRKK